MRLLFVGNPGARFDEQIRDLAGAGVQAESAPDPQAALWLLAGGDYRIVALDLRAGPLQWDVIAAALWKRPPARVVALAPAPVAPDLRRRAYGAGVWELIELPVRDGEGAAALMSAVRRAIGDDGEPAVLFADACSEITAGIGDLIAEHGYRVDPVGCTEEALRRMETRAYSLILTETRRTGPDGFRILQEAVRLQPGVPVVVFTASLDDQVFMKSVELGARACVWKLSEPEEIVRDILQAAEPTLDRRRPR